MTYLVKSEADAPPQDGGNWTFRLFISGSATELATIERVIYTLDPIFPNPVRISRNRETGFKIQFQTWGAFTVRLRIVRRTGEDCTEDYDLRRDNEKLPGLLDLGSGPRPNAMLALAKRLMRQKAFGDAARILQAALDEVMSGPPSETYVEIVQKLALCTYKNSSLPTASRLDQALAILDGHWFAIQGDNDPESLGLRGAIYKRKWQVDGQLSHLERSLHSYASGYKVGRAMPTTDARFECGAFPGINEAFLHDLLASEEGSATADPAIDRRSIAETVRLQIIKELSELLEKQPRKKDWFRTATLIEAYVGTDQYPEAEELIVPDEMKDVPDWEKETTCLQLATLIRLRAGPGVSLDDLKRSDAWRVLEKLTGGSAEAVRRAFVGKIGLGLSGGGFRASLYHIGVLARLAERGVLRHVEVLSCVSGGSIIGAHYYLALRRHLQTHLDSEITDEQYLKIVEDIAVSFLAGVQKNVRTRVAGDLWSNLRMIFQPDKYSRTERLAGLYESEFYGLIKDGEADGKRWLNDLFIQPLKDNAERKRVADEEFSPKAHNWNRKAKVPVLILNATTLNTGHMWQFSASWMGEPAEAINAEIDGNDRLRRVYYGEAPPEHRKVRLGVAVAASSCVPGLFDPIVLDKLYDGRTVRLVDGGVHDNQGIQGMLDQDCTVLLVSDACGQMDTELNPSKGALGVLLRTNGILQARVRTAQFDDLLARRRAALLKGAMFVHLKMGLEIDPVNPAGYVDRLGALCPAPPAEPHEQTAYGITLEAQRRIAALRTDLDSFTEMEAFALMTSGYRMTELALRPLDLAESAEDHRHEWRFLAIEDSLCGLPGADPSPEEALRQLGAGSKLAFKVWSLVKPLQYLAWALAAMAVLALGYVVFKEWDRPLFPTRTVGWAAAALGTAALGVVLGFFVNKNVLSIIHYQETLKRIVKGLALAAGGWLIAWIHILIFDRLFLRQGQVRGAPRRAQPLPPPPPEK